MEDIDTFGKDIVVVTNGKVRPAWAVEAVERLLQKVRRKNLWDVVDFLVSVFEKRFPEYSKARYTELKERRKRLKNPYASNKEKDLRHLVSIPVPLKDLMDYFLEDYENKEFWREFAKRYPQYSVPERSKI